MAISALWNNYHAELQIIFLADEIFSYLWQVGIFMVIKEKV